MLEPSYVFNARPLRNTPLFYGLPCTRGLQLAGLSPLEFLLFETWRAAGLYQGGDAFCRLSGVIVFPGSRFARDARVLCPAVVLNQRAIDNTLSPSCPCAWWRQQVMRCSMQLHACS